MRLVVVKIKSSFEMLLSRWYKEINFSCAAHFLMTSHAKMAREENCINVSEPSVPHYRNSMSKLLHYYYSLSADTVKTSSYYSTIKISICSYNHSPVLQPVKGTAEKKSRQSCIFGRHCQKPTLNFRAR